jgi:hypothetical protein
MSLGVVQIICLRSNNNNIAIILPYIRVANAFLIQNGQLDHKLVISKREVYNVNSTCKINITVHN